MQTAPVNDIEIEYELIGHGEPLLLIHGSNLATGLAPLAAALAAQAPYLQLVRYHRRGMAGSGGRGRPISVGQQAADALGLLDALGLPSAHLLGYSYGGVIAIEAALSAPARVRSLALLEPILTEVPSWTTFRAGMEPIMSLYAAGDMAGAARATFAGLGGPDWEELVSTAGPDALDLAVRDTELFYRAEAPSLTTWTLDETRAAAVQGPVLSVVGTQSGPFFEEGRQLLHQRFTRCADADIPGVNHLLNLQAPQPIATAVADFLQWRSDIPG
ncbi:alpha/beta hydrolase [Actinoallomurus sp. NPDC052308]|uniref:alpha/beta fold hydrolase n=1 Tax=Actinoallomurus sp. NPDC052308 TaxID=3155530 RepID=UPI00343E642E